MMSLEVWVLGFGLSVMVVSPCGVGCPNEHRPKTALAGFLD